MKDVIEKVTCPECLAVRERKSRGRNLVMLCRSCSIKIVKNSNDWSFKHGDTGTPLYKVWLAMKTRCSTTGQKYSKHYFDKGIRVCPEWREWEQFRNWAWSSGYQKGLSIDRIDNNGNYCPENCRWVSLGDNNRNRPSTKLKLASAAVIYDLAHVGAVSLRVLGALFGVHHNTVYEIKRGNNWPDAGAYLRGEVV